jgi:hypothetical protein
MRLTTLIDALPDESTKNIRAKGIVDDLIALLPRSNGSTVRPTDSGLAVVGPQQAQIRTVLSALFILILIIFALSARLSSAPEDGAKPSAPPVADATTALPHPHNP